MKSCLTPVQTRRLLLCCVALALLTPLFILGKVWYNRSDTAALTLTLSERDLRYRTSKENSGVIFILNIFPAFYNALDQAWKEAPLDTDPDKDINYRYASYNFIPEHLLRAAGIPTDELTENSTKRQRRQPVWYAIEFDGPVRRQGLEKYRALIGQAEAMLQEMPDNQKLAHRLESMRSALSERENGTRLFLVDFALEKDTLRQRYAAQSDILFLPGTLRFVYYNKDNGKTRLQGHFDELDNDSITIPSPWNRRFLSKDMPSGNGYYFPDEKTPSPRYQAEISWGRLAEPWIVTLSLHPGQKKDQSSNSGGESAQ